MKFINWRDYFISNRNHFAYLDWADVDPLTSNERKTITASIRQFQRGEHSEGKHFLHFAKELNDQSYEDAVKLFIKEEQDHAEVLGRFMAIHNIPPLKKDWLDNTFRKLRKLGGLEGSVTVLLSAEIISMVYYDALDRSTRSFMLQEISRQILVDEDMHLRFQSYTLRIVYSRKQKFSVLFSGILHSILMVGTILMVWFFHRKVLKAGGYHFASFLHAVWKQFLRCRKMILNKQDANPVFYQPVPKNPIVMEKIPEISNINS